MEMAPALGIAKGLKILCTANFSRLYTDDRPIEEEVVTAIKSSMLVHTREMIPVVCSILCLEVLVYLVAYESRHAIIFPASNKL